MSHVLIKDILQMLHWRTEVGGGARQPRPGRGPRPRAHLPLFRGARGPLAGSGPLGGLRRL